MAAGAFFDDFSSLFVATDIFPMGFFSFVS
jgi:hypothetical protein